MKDKNLIRIENLDQEVFRIFTLHRIEQLFTENRLILVRPAMWEDPFENFLLKCSVVSPNGELIGLQNIAQSWYGQCWTLNADSDAMWRIYSPNKDGIRIKTTIRKIADAIWEPNNQFASLKYFVGKVQYNSREAIEDFIQKTSFWNLAVGGQNTNFAETLLIKRTEFEHEKEIRILANSIGDPPDPRAVGDLYKIQIDPNQFIDEVCIDPRLTDAEASDVKSKIQSIGYTGTITQSELYKLRVTQIRIT